MTSASCRLGYNNFTLSIFQTIDNPLGDENLLDFVPIFAAHFGNQFFLSLDDFLMLSVPAQLKMYLGLETGDIDLPLVRFVQFFWLLVSHLRINS